MTKTKTNARETRKKHERVDGKDLVLFFVWDFENLNFDIVSYFVLRASCFAIYYHVGVFNNGLRSMA